MFHQSSVAQTNVWPQYEKQKLHLVGQQSQDKKFYSHPQQVHNDAYFIKLFIINKQ